MGRPPGWHRPRTPSPLRRRLSQNKNVVRDLWLFGRLWRESKACVTCGGGGALRLGGLEEALQRHVGRVLGERGLPAAHRGGAVMLRRARTRPLWGAVRT